MESDSGESGSQMRAGNRMLESLNSPPQTSSPCPTSFAGHGGIENTEGKAEVPSLDKEGWLRPLRKCREASLAGADGVVGSSHRLSEVERTTPAAPAKERDHLLDDAATPPLPRRGVRLCRRLSQTPVSSGRLVGNPQLRRGGELPARPNQSLLTLIVPAAKKSAE